jgi:membrane protein DedA with SNARE-associated domain
MDIVVLVVIASAAAIIGDNIGFTIGRKGGRKLFLRPGPFHRQRLRVLELGEPFFAKHGPKAVFLGRWVSGLRIASAWLAGMNGMSWPVFLVWNALGGIVWASAVGFGVYLAGQVAEDIITIAGPIAGGAAVLAVIVLLVIRHRRAHR